MELHSSLGIGKSIAARSRVTMRKGNDRHERYRARSHRLAGYAGQILRYDKRSGKGILEKEAALNDSRVLATYLKQYNDSLENYIFLFEIQYGY